MRKYAFVRNVVQKLNKNISRKEDYIDYGNFKRTI